ncbi:hypothetical protein C8046_16705 [Serinibacter arcticus]|uniref:Uncharacterized protein n=1 Tax=Serinibacter arcticus TaxID=1655435 RepID=A0A2U1ZYM1_9MICO|nr:hypothetical protein [Serinibacter arcticus]PWD52040.1 hypothetical protein C8046_16705 [Serinibacter arcticus]
MQNEKKRLRAEVNSTVEVHGQTVPDRCARCGRRYRERTREAARWNADFKSGFVTGLICPGCQTGAENLEAEINLIEAEHSERVDWLSLNQEERAELIVRAIEQRAVAVVRRHRDLASMAGETTLAIDVENWVKEAVDGWPGIAGQSSEVWKTAYAIAEDTIRSIIEASGQANDPDA